MKFAPQGFRALALFDWASFQGYDPIYEVYAEIHDCAADLSSYEISAIENELSRTKTQSGTQHTFTFASFNQNAMETCRNLAEAKTRVMFWLVTDGKCPRVFTPLPFTFRKHRNVSRPNGDSAWSITFEFVEEDVVYMDSMNLLVDMYNPGNVESNNSNIPAQPWISKGSWLTQAPDSPTRPRGWEVLSGNISQFQQQEAFPLNRFDTNGWYIVNQSSPGAFVIETKYALFVPISLPLIFRIDVKSILLNSGLGFGYGIGTIDSGGQVVNTFQREQIMDEDVWTEAITPSPANHFGYKVGFEANGSFSEIIVGRPGLYFAPQKAKPDFKPF